MRNKRRILYRNETKPNCFYEVVSGGETWDKNFSYLMSFFIYGYFGVIYQWIKYGFDETLEQVQKHIIDTFSAGLSQNI